MTWSKSRGSGAVVALALLAAVALLVLTVAYKKARHAGDAGDGEAHVYVPPPPIVIRPSEYRAIPMGALYRDVAKLIGSRGSRTSETSAGGYRSMAISWANPDGSNAQMIFSGKSYEPDEELALAAKAQFGLE